MRKVVNSRIRGIFRSFPGTQAVRGLDKLIGVTADALRRIESSPPPKSSTAQTQTPVTSTPEGARPALAGVLEGAEDEKVPLHC